MEKEYKGLKENLERFKNDFSDEKTRLLFSIGYKQGYDQALTLTDVGKSVTAKDLKCPSCKKHCLITYVDGKQCTSCGYVC